MTDNVISIGTRKPWREEQAERRKQRRSEGQKKRRAKDEAEMEHRMALLEMLENTKKLVEMGRLEGLIIIGRDAKPDAQGERHFYTDVNVDDRIVKKGDLFAWVGCMATLEMELKEGAMMAPALQEDGAILDPWENVQIEILGEDGEFHE